MAVSAIAVAAMSLLRAKELCQIIEKGEVTHALCDHALPAELDEAAAQSPLLAHTVFFGDASAQGLESRMAEQSAHFENVETAADDTCLLAFTFGLGGLTLFPMSVGAPTVLIEKASPNELVDAIPAFGATVLFTAPTSLRAMAAGARQHAISVPLGGTLRKCVSAGVAVPGYRACVLDDNMQPVPPGTVGRLAVKGLTGCRCLADPRQASYVRGGWNLTGDAYLMDADGYCHYQSRTDDMIVAAGDNIDTPEVEETLLAHPAVAEYALIGVADEQHGRIVKAFVVLRPDHAAGDALARALQDFVNARIAPCKYPCAFEFRATLPRTETGKLQRFRLRSAG